MKQEGKMDKEMGSIFEELAKPNHKIEKKKDKKKEEEEIKHKKKSSEPWYDISKDKGVAEYKWNGTTWVATGKTNTPTYSYSYTPSSYYRYHLPAISLNSFSSSSGSSWTTKSKSSYKPRKSTYSGGGMLAIKTVVVGDGAVGIVHSC